MRLKKLISMGLVVIMMLALAACGNSEKSQSTTSGGPTHTKLEKNDGQSETGTLEKADEDIAEINILFWTLNTVPSELDDVEEAINEITREKINTEIHLDIVDMGSYAQQVNLMVSSGEKLDLMVTLPGDTAHFNSMTSQNQLMDITELLEEYAPELLEIVPKEWLAGTTIDDKIYSVTSYGDKATPLCFVCRTDILEKTGIDPSTLKTAGDFTKLFAVVKDMEPQINPLTGSNKNVMTTPYMIDADGKFFSYDGLGEGNNSIIAIMPGDGSKISNRYETDEFRATCDWINQWYEAGYVDKDLANKDDTAESFIKGGTAFGYFKMVSGGSAGAGSMQQAHGYEMTVIELADAVINTGVIRKFSWAVPQNATEPEAAVKFMNLLYTDEDIVNLLTWGIEGQHYRTMEDGTLDFLEGQDANSCGYYLGDCSAIIGNGFIAKVRSGQSADYRQQTLELNQKAQVSEFLGFGIDNTSAENTLTALTNVVKELRPALGCGLKGSEGVQEMIDKLKAADVDRYIADMQKQLDDWIAANK